MKVKFLRGYKKFKRNSEAEITIKQEERDWLLKTETILIIEEDEKEEDEKEDENVNAENENVNTENEEETEEENAITEEEIENEIPTVDLEKPGKKNNGRKKA